MQNNDRFQEAIIEMGTIDDIINFLGDFIGKEIGEETRELLSLQADVINGRV